MTPDLVLCGNLLVDDLVFPDGRTHMGQPGGAVLYASLAASLWGARVGALSVAGEDYPPHALDALRLREVDLAGVRASDRPSLRTWLLYEGRVRRVVHRLCGPTHDDVSPSLADLPESWRAARAAHLAPMPMAVQRALIRDGFTDRGTFVSADPYTPVTEQTLADWRDLLAHCDAFFPSEDELLLEEAATDPRAALLRLAGGRLRFIAFKRGLKGGLLYDAAHDRFHEWQPRTDGLADPTGAGDAFAAGLITAHLEGLPVEACLERAVVTASFAIEAWGAEGLMAATRAEADARLQRWYGAGVRR